MEKLLINLPGYQVYEYLLVLAPHEDLRNKVMKIKKEFGEKYKAQNAQWGRPTIALVNFYQYKMMEERIVHRLNMVAMGHYPFKVELKDFGSFPSHTIYIKVPSRLPIQKLVKTIQTETQRLLKPDNDHKPHFIQEEPHITIARKLLPWQYEKAWLEYSHKQFTCRFIANAMLLLKRPEGEIKYQVVKEFEFQNIPVNTAQGNLFDDI